MSKERIKKIISLILVFLMVDFTAFEGFAAKVDETTDIQSGWSLDGLGRPKKDAEGYFVYTIAPDDFVGNEVEVNGNLLSEYMEMMMRASLNWGKLETFPIKIVNESGREIMYKDYKFRTENWIPTGETIHPIPGEMLNHKYTSMYTQGYGSVWQEYLPMMLGEEVVGKTLESKNFDGKNTRLAMAPLRAINPVIISYFSSNPGKNLGLTGNNLTNTAASVTLLQMNAFPELIKGAFTFKNYLWTAITMEVDYDRTYADLICAFYNVESLDELNGAQKYAVLGNVFGGATSAQIEIAPYYANGSGKSNKQNWLIPYEKLKDGTLDFFKTWGYAEDFVEEGDMWLKGGGTISADEAATYAYAGNFYLMESDPEVLAMANEFLYGSSIRLTFDNNSRPISIEPDCFQTSERDFSGIKSYYDKTELANDHIREVMNSGEILQDGESIELDEVKGYIEVPNAWKKEVFFDFGFSFYFTGAGCEIIYDGNGHTSGTAPVDSRKYMSNSEVTVLGQNDLHRDGYVFLGWSIDKSANAAEFIEGSTFVITEDTIFYAIWEKEIPIEVDLISTKMDNLPSNKIKIGDTFKYTISVKNTGNTDDKNILITDNIPSKLDIISVTPSTAKITGQKIEYTVPEIKAGETFTMTIEVKVNSSAKDGDKIKNIAVVDGKDVPSRELIVDEPSTSTGWTWSGGGSTTTLNKEDHYAYMIGYPNGTVKPEGKITRAEVSTIFFRMMTDNSRNSNWSSVNNYNDVGAETWYNNAISTLSNAKAVTGYPDGSFKPNAKITRGEFATMASRFLSDTSSLTNNKFTDVKGNWAESEINKLASLGLISGYTDGSFKPDQEITRAEAATLMNAVLKRTPDKDHLLSNMKTWTDNSNRNAWYYAQIQEATNSHTYTRISKTSIETWRELLPVRDWAALEKTWSNANFASGGGSVIK